MKYFTIEELCQSETADKLKIDNTPSEEIKKNLEILGDCLLDPLREAWGSPIIINSGYRCPILNKAVGGSKTSSHMSGWSVDMRPKNGKMEEFKKFVIDFIKTKDAEVNIPKKLDKFNNFLKPALIIATSLEVVALNVFSSQAPQSFAYG